MGTEADSELPAGTIVAGHRILWVTGRGGMGIVYRAQEIGLDRPVALKLIAARLSGDPAFRERFIRESRAAAAIDHPNVVPVYSAGEGDGHLYLAMRFVEGRDLRALVHDQGPLAPRAAARMAEQIGGALDAAHARGLVHRDVKPANVLLDADHAYLTDFGLTKRVDGETTMTGSGRWVGTLGYTSPEQIRSEPVDARSDVYALGCLLHFMLAGRSPYRRDSDEATIYAHLNDPPPRLDVELPGIPTELADVVVRALAKDPQERFQSAGDLGAAAMAACGAAPARPERVVARGAAAPGSGRSDDTATASERPTPTPEAPTTPAADPGKERPGPFTRARLAGLGVGVAVLAAVAIAAVLMRPGSGERSDGPRARTSAGLLAGTPIAVDPRPNSIAYGYGHVWVTSARTGRLTRIPVDGSAPVRQITIGGPITQVVAAFGAIWVTTGLDHHLVKVAPGTMQVMKRLALPRGDAVAVAADGRRLWVGMRPPGIISSLIAVDPRTGRQTSLPPFGEEGIAGLAAGDGRVWVANRRRPRVSAVDAATFDRRSSPQIGGRPRGIAVGKGYAWVTLAAQGTLARVSAGLANARLVPACAAPAGVAVGAAGVWVACNLADEVLLLRPDRLSSPLRVRVGSNPFAIATDGDRAWVTNLADGTVTPLRASGR